MDDPLSISLTNITIKTHYLQGFKLELLVQLLENSALQFQSVVDYVLFSCLEFVEVNALLPVFIAGLVLWHAKLFKYH